ncbi:putative auto-transporter adhesin, head GIN domain [Kordia sp. SMS9]|uniref:GIN domain-containing protein n=1 Tax=Kordia sp. SMS9 TaxID=2282170 RepID=UPI000E0CEBDE|nr:DUF2807 domain-containing protein [Kordia sp. SMS9]AXG71420.1 putative auto-transporter adhesin, head GIN domain [Kordia sp. SMS9]
MKTYLITVLFLLGTLTTFAQKKEKIKGNREVTTVIYELDPFTNLELKEALEIVLINGETPKVEVIADENLHEIFNIDVVDGTLQISTSKEIRSSKKLEIFVTVSSALTKIDVDNDAVIKSLTTLNLKNTEINALGNAELNLRIKSDSLTINSYGKTEHTYELFAKKLQINAFEDADMELTVTADSITSRVEFAEVKLKGETKKLITEVKEKGEFIAHELMADDVHVTTTEQGKAVVNASKNITISAHQRSEIDLLGNPSSIVILKFEQEAVLRKISEANKGFLKRIF